MQSYKPIKANDFMSRSRETINNNMQSIASDFSGTSFPTANLFAYMRCYREDQNKLYRLQANLKTWRLETDFSGEKVTVENSHSAESAEKSDSLTAEHVVRITTNNAKTGFVIVSEELGKQTSKVEELDMFVSLKQQLLDFCFPVGYVMTTASSVNPSETHGGTWKLITEGTFIVAAGSSSKYKQGQTGGEAEHVLMVDEMPIHNHGGATSNSGEHSHTTNSAGDHYHGSGWGERNNYGSNYGIYDSNNNHIGSGDTDYDNAIHRTSTNGAHTHTTTTNGAHTHTVQSDGKGVAHNNLPPYLAMYMWQRIK